AAMGHIELAKWADLILIAPATADLIARLAQGIANDLLTTIVLLEQRDFRVFGPASGSQACGDVGFGRMLEADDLAQCAAD
ncbi:bifunctional phosphopantothenoylcysteine decarboxylase/phosphopantothenate synthase, partial [Pseudomonas syringae pv. actinidiae ICMP 19101]